MSFIGKIIFSYDKDPHAQLMLQGALGFESKKVYAGFTASTLIRNMKYKE